MYFTQENAIYLYRVGRKIGGRAPLIHNVHNEWSLVMLV